MSDIDFDELDKAVNSLVGDDSADKKEPVTQVSSDDSAPKDTTPKIGPALASRRSSGRFMDMKHDSSDMQKKDNSLLGGTAKTNISPLSPGVTADGLSSQKSDAETAKKSDWPDPINTKKDNQEAKESSSDSSTDMPDPLDHIVASDTKNDDSNEPYTETEDKEVSKDEPEIDYEETDEKKDEKKESPFLDDAKVEKRPLGGFSDESPVIPPSTSDAKDDKDSMDEEKAQPPSEQVELPPELDKDLVAIEAGEALEIQNPSPAEDVPKEEEGKSEKTQEKNVSGKDKKSDQKEKVSELLASAATGSIPDQYKRENRSHELHAPHPLFDDDHYKGDLKTATPKPPKSLVARIFQWILIGVGILLLGGFLGASFFVFASGQ